MMSVLWLLHKNHEYLKDKTPTICTTFVAMTNHGLVISPIILAKRPNLITENIIFHLHMANFRCKTSYLVIVFCGVSCVHLQTPNSWKDVFFWSTYTMSSWGIIFVINLNCLKSCIALFIWNKIANNHTTTEWLDKTDFRKAVQRHKFCHVNWQFCGYRFMTVLAWPGLRSLLLNHWPISKSPKSTFHRNSRNHEAQRLYFRSFGLLCILAYCSATGLRRPLSNFSAIWKL